MRSLGQSQERCLLRLLVIAAVIFATGEAMAQSSSIFERDLPQTGQAPIMLDGGSWTYIPPVLPRRINIHDRVTIRVDELASMTQEGDVQQRRTAQYNAVLKDWIGLIGLKAIKPNAQNDGDQTINGQLTNVSSSRRYRSSRIVGVEHCLHGGRHSPEWRSRSGRA